MRGVALVRGERTRNEGHLGGRKAVAEPRVRAWGTRRDTPIPTQGRGQARPDPRRCHQSPGHPRLLGDLPAGRGRRLRVHRHRHPLPLPHQGGAAGAVWTRQMPGSRMPSSASWPRGSGRGTRAIGGRVAGRARRVDNGRGATRGVGDLAAVSDPHPPGRRQPDRARLYTVLETGHRTGASGADYFVQRERELVGHFQSTVPRGVEDREGIGAARNGGGQRVPTAVARGGQGGRPVRTPEQMNIALREMLGECGRGTAPQP